MTDGHDKVSWEAGRAWLVGPAMSNALTHEMDDYAAIVPLRPLSMAGHDGSVMALANLKHLHHGRAWSESFANAQIAEAEDVSVSAAQQMPVRPL
jgi:hypothetical protein